MSKGRLTAYTDAILAIIATILVLSLPDLNSFSYHALASHWQAYIIYVITFLQLMAIWLNHHNLFAGLKKITSGIFWANAIWLLVISFLPYAVKWVGEYPNKWQPETFYVFIIVLGSVMFSWLRVIAGRTNGFKVKIRNWIYVIFVPAVIVTYFIPFFGIVTAAFLIINLIMNPMDRDLLD
ncbi:TMEM175 family protein [Furfurilactobacillus entadae]|uniref:TMEM175 family protein n=1 Tax=Furfurilactobacillus entadae TaxID=2922307 RepID=UPI0035EFD9D7